MKKKSTLKVTGFVGWLDNVAERVVEETFEDVSKKIEWPVYEGKQVNIEDLRSGGQFTGTVRTKAVRCGKPTCKKCPHKIYAYAQFRDGKRVREKYLGIAR